MLDWIAWFFTQVFMAFYNFAYAITHPGLWLDWSNKEAIARFIYYGASVELFFVVLVIFVIATSIGVLRHRIMWGYVRVLEGVANTVGRVVAWAGLIMVIQQILIVFMQRVFVQPSMSFGFGIPVEFDMSWFAEELKLYNAMIVCLCVAYTFVQGGHVRVDLFYASARFRTKKVLDMLGALVFMAPFAILTWLYAWFFLWRVLVVPNPSASNTLERLVMQAGVQRWNVQTISASPNGFNGYFLFKILLCLFCAMVLLQAFAVFYRSYLEYREGPESAGKYLDRDSLGAGEEAYEGTH